MEVDNKSGSNQLHTLMRLQNQKKPDQVVEVNWNKKSGFFETQGLKHLFDVNEVRVNAGELLANIEEYAWVLYWLLESMSVADDLGVPFAYEEYFSVGSVGYTLKEDGDGYMILSRDDTQKE